MDFIKCLEKSSLSSSERSNLELYYSKKHCLENVNRNQQWFYEDLNFENCNLNKSNAQIVNENISKSKHKMKYHSINFKEKQVPKPILKNECQTTPTKSLSILKDPATPSSNWKMLTTLAASLSYANGKSKMDKDENRTFINTEDKENIHNSSMLEAGCSKKPSRKDKSLGLLCKRFLALYPEYPSSADIVVIGLDEVSKELGVERRRIYDIVNVLESFQLLIKIGKNKYRWFGKGLLPKTLHKLQIMAKKENLAEQIQAMKDIEFMQSLEGSCNDRINSNSTRENISVPYECIRPIKSYDDFHHSIATGGRKEKSLGVMSQKFLMLFLVSAPKILNLDLAAKVLIGNASCDKKESIKFKTKIRRLYDIANILSSLGLIQKIYVTELKERKPAFKYVGPDLDNIDENSDYEILCDNSLTLLMQSFLNENSSSAHNDSENSYSSTTDKETQSKLVRHASLQEICEVAEQEREKMFSNENKHTINTSFDAIYS